MSRDHDRFMLLGGNLPSASTPVCAFIPIRHLSSAKKGLLGWLLSAGYPRMTRHTWTSKVPFEPLNRLRDTCSS